MNGLNVAVIAMQLLGQFIPKPKPPKTDYESLRKLYQQDADARAGVLDRFTPSMSSAAVEIVTDEQPEIPELTALPSGFEEIEQPPVRLTGTGAPVATSCIACSRSHIATIAGALEEAIRFARDEGVTSPDSLKRIDVAEKEINIMERIDLSPEAIQNSPEKDKNLARYFLPKIRSLRQNIGQISSVDKLEQAAAEASVLSQEFRLKQMEANGANLNPILELARKVQAGEMTMEEARAKVKEYLPKEQ